MGLPQLVNNFSNLGSSLDSTYFHVQKLAILSTHIRQSTSPFSASQLPQNMDEKSFSHFINHLVGMQENSKSKHKQGRLMLKQDQLPIQMANHNQSTQL